MREFREELDIEVGLRGDVMVMENIYTHHGVMGHEVLFISEITFPQGAFEGLDVLRYHEDNGAACTARWFDLNALRRGEVQLFPDGLLARLG